MTNHSLLRTRIPAALTALLALLAAMPGAAEPPAGAPPDRPTGLDPTALTALDRKLQDAIAAGRYEEARELGATILAERPADPFVRYDYARALSMLGEGEAAVEALLDAISYGLTDFHQMDADPLLAEARRTQTYARILAGWRALLDDRGERNLAQLEDAFGDDYTYATDDTLRLHMASSLDEASFAEARREIERVTGFARLLFPGPTAAADARPHAWVTVLIPTREDFLRVVRMLGVGGIYENRTKRLITRDIGPGLRHEFFHVLHYRHMAELNQEHAYWIMEGLACLVEDASPDSAAAGGLRIEPSWRTNIARRLARSGSLVPLERFVRLERDEFVGARARARYAQARALFMFLHERGELEDWYRAYTADFAEDPTGLAAIEAAFGRPLREIEREFRMWARALPEVGEADEIGGAELPFAVGPGPADGLRVDEYVPRRLISEGEAIRRGDVVLAVDGETIRTHDDLFRVLGGREAGQTVRLTLRRGDRRFEAAVELTPTGGL